ncbi:MAG: selenium cofactor biosynthesis protein YqeC [Planctomycetes bacterium]|nr:selenium cofactor biosynthesis protein YqeC [Planctomycetota bacterium]
MLTFRNSAGNAVSLQKELSIGNPELVSIVGGGGKTSLLKALSRELCDEGLFVLAGTTTKMRIPEPEEFQVVFRSEIENVGMPEPAGKPAFIVGKMDEKKVFGLEKEFFDDIFVRFGKTIIIEADGSRHLPIKGHGDFEPVIPSKTTTIVYVLGASALGKPVSDEWVHRCDLVKSTLGLSDSAIMDHEIIRKIIGTFKKRWYPHEISARNILLITQTNTIASEYSFGKLRSGLENDDLFDTIISGYFEET